MSRLRLVYSNSNRPTLDCAPPLKKLRMSRVTFCRSPQNTALLRKLAYLIDRSPGHAAVLEKLVEKALKQSVG